jgi:hypothetical protein
MVFRTSIKDPQGNPVNDLLVVANDLRTGASYSRSTADGYADVDTQDAAIGNRVTFYVLDPSLRFTGLVFGDAFVITRENQELNLTVRPFV